MRIGSFAEKWVPRVAITPKPPNKPKLAQAIPGSDSSIDPKPPRPWWHRWLWFVGLWGASVLLIYLISLLIRWAIVP